MAYSSEDLINLVKLTISEVNTSWRYSDADILTFAKQVIDYKLYPFINNLNVEHFVIQVDVPIVSGPNFYTIPYRAYDSNLRDFIYTDTNVYKLKLREIEPEDAHLYISATSVPYGYTFQGDDIFLLPEIAPNINPSANLRMFYILRHSNLVPSSSTSVVQSVNFASNVVTLQSALPSAPVGTYIDFIRANRMSNAKIISFDKVIQNVAGPQLTFNPGDIPTTLVAGDIVALAEQTSVICLPSSAFTALANCVAADMLLSQKDLDSYSISSKKLEGIFTELGNALDPRSKGTQRMVVNYNGLLYRNANQFPRRRVSTP